MRRAREGDMVGEGRARPADALLPSPRRAALVAGGLRIAAAPAAEVTVGRGDVEAPPCHDGGRQQDWGSHLLCQWRWALSLVPKFGP